MDIIRDSSLGQLIRFATRNKVLLYEEEKSTFSCPQCYDNSEKSSQENIPTQSTTNNPSSAPSAILNSEDGKEDIAATGQAKPGENLAQSKTADRDVESGYEHLTMWKVPTQPEIQKTYTEEGRAERAVSTPIEAVKTADGTILVDWYATDDPANPQNWSAGKKNFVAFQICTYSFAVYVGSSIYSPTIPEVMETFKVGQVPAALGLALYVLAYGIGPMVFSPLSEIPVLGRNPIYIATFVIFVILQIPTGVVENFAGLLVLRFLAGIFGSPCLATGAATFQDMYSMLKVPYLIALWAAAVTMGPALAPVIAGFSVGVKGWHWFAWELLWLSGPICVLMFITLPETSSANILLRRARRLRRITGKTHMKSQSEIDQEHMSANEVAYDALIKPWQINFLDPAVAFTTIYTALVYGIFYSFFESFPLVYPTIYKFNMGESNLPFLSVVVSLIVCVPAYCGYFYYIVTPRVMKVGFGAPEGRLVPGLYATFCVPAGMFLFAWTTREDVHWIVSVIGLFLTMCGCYVIIQAMFLYLPFTYPQYAASLFAANDFARSSFAAGCILFSGPMFNNLGVAKGCSLLGGLAFGCTIGIYVLYYFGSNLRARSRFAVK